MSKWLEELVTELRRAEATKENLLRSIQSNEEEIRSFEDSRAVYKAEIQAHLNAVHMLNGMDRQMLRRIQRVWFICSVNPSVSGWQAADRNNADWSESEHRLDVFIDPKA
jgi:hypothetical protein